MTHEWDSPDRSKYNNLVEAAQESFASRYGRPPRWVVIAPGRVNLIGGHTDYNEGFVLPMAIDRHVAIAADLSPAKTQSNLYSTLVEKSVDFSLDDLPETSPGVWSSYVIGTLALCKQKGLDVPAFDAVIHADLPLGGGLSSSAALEVAVATLAETVSGGTLDKVEKALLCQKAEHEYAGTPCGIMDQFSSIFGQDGHLMLLDCRSREIEMVPLADPTICVLIINSNVKHELAGGEYASRRADCAEAAKILGIKSLRDATMEMLDRDRESLGEVCYRRARHVVTEIERTQTMVKEIRDGQWERAGELIYGSHASLRDNYEVSCRELDLLVELAREIGPAGGMFGSRLTGGGFGGCTVSLVRADAVPSITETIERRYHEQTGTKPAIFATRPSDGPCVVRLQE